MVNLWIDEAGREDKCDQLLVTAPDVPLQLRWTAQEPLDHDEVRIMSLDTLDGVTYLKQITHKDATSTVFAPQLELIKVKYEGQVVIADLERLDFGALDYYIFQAQVRKQSHSEWRNSTRVIIRKYGKGIINYVQNN